MTCSRGAGGQEARRLQPEYEPIVRVEAFVRTAEPQCRAQKAARNVAAADAATAGDGGGLRNEIEGGRDGAASAREEAAAAAAAALVSKSSARIARRESGGLAQALEAEDEEWEEDPSVTISGLAGAVVVTWPVVHNSGWGVFSRNLLRQMLSSGRHTPLLTVPLEVRVACVCVRCCHCLCESSRRHLGLVRADDPLPGVHVGGHRQS